MQKIKPSDGHQFSLVKSIHNESQTPRNNFLHLISINRKNPLIRWTGTINKNMKTPSIKKSVHFSDITTPQATQTTSTHLYRKKSLPLKIDDIESYLTARKHNHKLESMQVNEALYKAEIRIVDLVLTIDDPRLPGKAENFHSTLRETFNLVKAIKNLPANEKCKRSMLGDLAIKFTEILNAVLDLDVQFSLSPEKIESIIKTAIDQLDLPKETKQTISAKTIQLLHQQLEALPCHASDILLNMYQRA